MSASRTSHVADVLDVAEGKSTPHDEIIRESWMRCVTNHHLDPSQTRNVYVHTDQEIKVHRSRLEDFLRTARFGLEALYQDVAGLGYALLLTDAKGVTIDFIGDPTYGNQLRNSGLYIGSLWSEEHAGTNGVGTCIATGRSLVVHQRDHFSSDHIDLSCTAAPIFGPDGKLAAVLDISALRSPEEKASQQLALTLVNGYAHRIENATLLNGYPNNWVLKLSRSPEFLCVDPEHVIVLDDRGNFEAFNSKATHLLRQTLGLPTGSSVNGYSFEDVFDCKLSQLGDFVRALPSTATAVRIRRSGATLFMHAHPPRPKIRRTEAVTIEKLPKPLAELTGGDQNIVGLLRRVAKLASTSVSLLIQGETGSGKERLAKAIHEASGRGTFVPVNCAAIPETLIESELFGYEPGAFTGARAKGKVGLIARANGGTLFLDEIGDMPIQLQTRLLRALAEREIIPLGNLRPIALDIRVISATHRDLIAAIKAGEFRQDLYYRLNGFEFTLPALRDRTDLAWLIEKIVSDRVRNGETAPTFTPEALDYLLQHNWPGNVRELLNVIELALAVSGGGRVTPDDLPDSVKPRMRQSEPVRQIAVMRDMSDGDAFLQDGLDDAGLRSHLVRRQWNVSQVARDLNLDRTTVHRRMKKLGIVSPNNE